jgi:hypothetical protein
MALPPGLGAGSPWSDALEPAAHGFLARTRSAIAMAQLDDLAGNLDQVNLPGGAGAGLAGAPRRPETRGAPGPCGTGALVRPTCLVAGGGMRTRDPRVVSLTSRRAAPPRATGARGPAGATCVVSCRPRGTSPAAAAAAASSASTPRPRRTVPTPLSGAAPPLGRGSPLGRLGPVSSRVAAPAPPAYRRGGLPRPSWRGPVSRRVSRLDAFSGYPFRTWPPGRAAGATTGPPGVRPPRSSRTRGGSSQASCARGR